MEIERGEGKRWVDLRVAEITRNLPITYIDVLCNKLRVYWNRYT